MDEILIYENENSLSVELCRDIIELFENNEDNGKYQGVTGRGLNKNIKDTTDLVITSFPRWENINLCLKRELQKNLVDYIKRLNNTINYRVISDLNLSTFSMQMQKYNRNEGKYTYHNDSKIENTKTRMITFIWYLNDVIEGGETEIWEYLKIKPTTGKLLLFPSCWTFPHRGNVPISSDKYIITGWLWSTF
jgi:hypothetical protein